MLRLFKKSVLSKNERLLLKIIPKEYRFLARNKNGLLVAFKKEPEKQNDCSWTDYRFNSNRNLKMFNHLFKFITFEDDRAYSMKVLRRM